MRVNKRSLSRALSVLTKIAGRTGAIHCAGTNNLLRLSVVDGDLRLTHIFDAPGRDFTVNLPAKVLADVVKSADGNEVDIDEQGLVLGGLRVKLPGAVSDEVKTDESRDWHLVARWPAAPLREALNFVLPAMSTDTTRPNICQLCFDRDQLVATDGHRLHMAKLPVPIDQPLVIPAKAAKLLRRLLTGGQNVRIGQDGKHLRIHIDRWLFDVVSSDAGFPDYHFVVPEQSETRLRVDAEVLANAIRQLRPLSDSVRVCVNGALKLQADELASLQVPTLANNHQGPELVTGFNTRYLLDAIGTGELSLGFNDALSPLRISHDNRISVVMPIRI